MKVAGVQPLRRRLGQFGGIARAPWHIAAVAGPGAGQELRVPVCAGRRWAEILAEIAFDIGHPSQDGPGDGARRGGGDLLHDGELVGGNDRGKRSAGCARIRARQQTEVRRAGREAEQRL